jgi:hypothetical protein
MVVYLFLISMTAKNQISHLYYFLCTWMCPLIFNKYRLLLKKHFKNVDWFQHQFSLWSKVGTLILSQHNLNIFLFNLIMIQYVSFGVILKVIT